MEFAGNPKYGSIGNIVLEDVDGEVGNKITSSVSQIDDLPDEFEPAFHSISRRSTQLVAVFNLLSTIVGGGTLSLPFAFSKCGYLGGTALVLASVAISITTLQSLCKLSRKLGTTKYSEVMDRAIGQGYGDLSNLLIMIMLLFVVIAFMIIEKDIAGDILDFLVEGDYGNRFKSSLLIILTILTLPVMMAKNLYSLRHVSYLGICSVCLLLFVIIIKSINVNYEHPERFNELARVWPENIGDLMYSLPIILIAFFCQFNILGVYSNLYIPSTTRINQVVSYSIFGSGAIYIMFGVSGYLFAYNKTLDNVLNNFSSHDPSLIIARIGLLLTIICQIPMVVVPCRDSLIQLIIKYQTSSQSGITLKSEVNGINDQRQPAIVTVSTSSTPLHQSSPWNINNYKYTSEITTMLIAIMCLIFSECVPGVATIWSLAGSSISLILAFYLPARAYVTFSYEICPSASFRDDVYLGFSNVMYYVSIAMIGLCTYQAIIKL